MTSSTSARQALEAARAALAAGRMDALCDHARAAWVALADPADAAARAEAGYLACMAQHRLGRWAELTAFGQSLIDDPHLPLSLHHAVEVRRWLTLAACELTRFDLGLQLANESCQIAEAAGDAVQKALSLMSLSICIERIGDPWQAHRLMEEALAMVPAALDTTTRVIILNNLSAAYIGEFYLLRESGSADELSQVRALAVSHAREGLALAQGLHDSRFITGVLESNLAEALLQDGDADAAAPLLEAAHARLAVGIGRNYRIRYCDGELLLARGQAQQACELLTQLWHDMADSGQNNVIARVHDALHRAWRRLGDWRKALDHLERYRQIDRARVVAQLKAQSSLFVTRAEAERARLEVQAERRRAEAFEADAQHDQLTGLGNRRYLDRRMPGLLASASESARPLAVALVDLDHFKRVNDRFGHAVGDRVLQTIADLLREQTRAQDVLVRLGGEEFLVVLDDTELPVAREVCERLRQHVRAHDWQRLADGLGMTLSIGLAAAPSYALEDLTHRADLALYRAKSEGRDKVC